MEMRSATLPIQLGITVSNKEEQLLKIVRDQFGLNEDEASLDSNLVEDFDADSLDQVELLMAVEDEFDIEIADEEFENVATVRDMLVIISRKAPQNELG